MASFSDAELLESLVMSSIDLLPATDVNSNRFEDIYIGITLSKLVTRHCAPTERLSYLCHTHRVIKVK